MSGLIEQERPAPRARVVMLWVLVLQLLAVGAGVLWSALARPSAWDVTSAGIVMTEDASTGQVGVELLYVGIGAALCLAWGLAAGVLLRRLGWRLAVVVALGASAAAAVAWWVGVRLGPPDPVEVASDVQLGDTIQAMLSVDAPASFLVWPIAGLVGLLVATVATDRRPAVSERSEPAPLP